MSCVIRFGAFYNCFGKDAYILSYLFRYRIKNNNQIATCGFPKGGIAKVMSRLEQQRINYIMIDTRNNYDVDYKMNFKNLNTYNEKLERAKKYVKIRQKIENIYKKLEQEIENEQIGEKIKRIEEIINAN